MPFDLDLTLILLCRITNYLQYSLFFLSMVSFPASRKSLWFAQHLSPVDFYTHHLFSTTFFFLVSLGAIASHVPCSQMLAWSWYITAQAWGLLSYFVMCLTANLSVPCLEIWCSVDFTVAGLKVAPLLMRSFSTWNHVGQNQILEGLLVKKVSISYHGFIEVGPLLFHSVIENEYFPDIPWAGTE